MEYPNISKLYKYNSFGTRSIYSILNGKIWFPKPNMVNDPFDCAIVNHSLNMFSELKKEKKEFLNKINQARSVSKTPSELEIKIRELHDNFILNFQPKEKELIDAAQSDYSSLQSSIYDFGILSLSETPKSILMWSHYASSHTGICFEFERTSNNKLGSDAKPVSYSRKREPKDSKSQNNTHDLFFVKYSGWRYEKEWRLLESVGNQLYDFPGKLVAIICGSLMSEKDIETIKIIVELINSKHADKISVKYAKMSDKNYTISIRNRQ